MSRDMQNELAHWRGNLQRMTRHYEQWCKDSIIKKMQEILTTVDPDLQNLLTPPRKHYERYLDALKQTSVD
ncbi:MAG: hypothetical protein J7L89_09905 [Bacteroidales bacterium]|nr:hypothetical protein [Bacteroidales bacterium]